MKLCEEYLLMKKREQETLIFLLFTILYYNVFFLSRSMISPLIESIILYNSIRNSLMF